MPNQYIPPPDEAYPGLRALGDAYLASQSAREGIFGRLEYHPQQQQARQQRGHTRITPVPVPVPIPVQSQQQQFAERAAALDQQQQQRHFAGQQDEARPFDGAATTGQFGILAPDDGIDGGTGPIVQTGGKLPVRMVVAPPDLQAWREKLFHVDDVIVLTQEEFETYFPHVDNVYSHRSTQKYKRKPFISHYWDCRMKGRPPGTPKTDDPSKKRRRRSARERDLCDVKIKITEYFPGSEAYYQAENGGASSVPLEGQKFWTIQRVNGNGGNGKGDGVAGPHKHTLERSDEIKKNSVQRWMAAQDREVKVAGVRRASGAALATIKRRAKDADIKFHAACYCPFSQRVWIALQAKGLAYQYVETDPLRQKAGGLEGNPRGKVPSVKQGDWTCAESWVILEYLDELDPRVPLLPADAKMTATCRLWIDHINTQIVPAFYALLANQDGGQHARLVDNLQNAIGAIALVAHDQGPFFLGPQMSLVDVHIAPFAQRLRTVLHPKKGYPMVDGVTSAGPLAAGRVGERWARWVAAIEANEAVRATTSGDEVYAETASLLLKTPVA